MNSNVPILKIVKNDKELKDYIENFNEKGLKALNQPENYIGIAIEKTEKICNFWEEKMQNMTSYK